MRKKRTRDIGAEIRDAAGELEPEDARRPVEIPPVAEPRARVGLKELLLAMPLVGEDSDFERSPDHGRDVEF